MNPENIIEICVALDIAILGIAYPIIIDKISNIGDKYSSQYIPVLFNSELPQRTFSIIIFKKAYYYSIFKLTVYATLMSFFLLIFKFNPPFNWDNWFINYSADYLVLFLSTTLTVFFFIWLDKVALYNGKSKTLLKHIIARFDTLKDESDLKQYHLKAINEFTYYAIERQDEHLQETLLDFYYKVFAKIRKSHDKNIPLEYPIDLYFLVNRLNYESTNNENKKLKAIEHRAVSGAWLLGEDFEQIPISESTYTWIWRNVCTICDHTRLMKMFWANSHQYFNYKLDALHLEYDSKQGKYINEEEITKRNVERTQFLEFHFALGGLMLYRKQYALLDYVFTYTQSQPPDYVLLPDSMTDIFYWLENFNNEYKNDRKPIDFTYTFPDLDNLGNMRQVIYWICCYLAILFIRQYSLNRYYVYQEFTKLPDLPEDISELSSWLENVSYFEKCLKDILINKELISGLAYEELVEEKQNDFGTFLSELKDAIKDKIGFKKLNAQLSIEKIQCFYDNSNEIITKAFKEYDSIFTSTSSRSTEHDLKLSVNGARTLLSKSSFTDGDITVMGYETVFASSIATNTIKRIIPNSFAIARTRRYLLEVDLLTQAINKLIDNNREIEIIAVQVGYKIQKVLEESNFQHLVKFIPSTEYQNQNAIFVLRNRDLPTIEHKNIEQSEIEDLKLVLINKELNIYASVIDINQEENKYIKDKWNLGNDSENLELKVQLAIAFIGNIYWKKEREVIQINLVSELREQGIKNDLNDIEPIK